MTHQAWRTMAKFVSSVFRARLYFEPRDAWIGVFWDQRGPDLNIWICVVPFFPIQIVFRDDEHESCPCGFRHSFMDPPPWCLRLRELQIENETFRKLYENPFFVQHVRHRWPD